MDLAVSEQEISIIEGGFTRINDNGNPKDKYWVSLFQGNNSPVHYLKHKWTPVACTYSPGAGLCASADKFGQIHVWKARDGKQVSVFEPVNHNLYHVEWMPDESGFYLGTRFFGSRGAQKFGVNHYGPITNSFSLTDWKLRPESGYQAQHKKLPITSMDGSDQEYQLLIENQSDIVLKSSSGLTENLSQLERSKGAQQKETARKWGKPTCIQFLDSANEGRLPFIVGTDNGSLLQFSIEKRNGRDNLKLRRSFVSHDAQVNSISISPSGEMMASCSLDGTVRAWRLDPPRKLAEVDFYTDGARVVDMELNGSAYRAGLQIGDSISEFNGEPYYERIQKLQRGEFKAGDSVTIGFTRFVKNGSSYREEKRDIKIRLVEAPDVQEPLLNLFLTKNDDWITWTRNGFYNASPNGSRHVGFHVNQGREKAAEFTLVSQFQKQLFQPSLVEEVIKTWTEVTDETAANSNESGMHSVLVDAPNTAEKYEKVRPPKITILSPYGATKSETGTVKVEFEVQRPNSLELTELRVFNNGRNQRAKPEEQATTRKSGYAKTTYVSTIKLLPGDNNIVVTAEHEAASSNNAELFVEYLAPKSKSELPKLYVLAIGVSEYEDSTLDLDYADNDAEDFVAAWKEQEGGMYGEVIHKVIQNAEATVDGIEDGFSWLTDHEFNNRDVVLVFLAGHALFDKHDIWVFGSTEMNEEKLARTGITGGRFQRLLEKELVGAGTVIAYLDTCHAGGVKTRGKQRKTRHSRKIDIWQGSQHRIFASCVQEEKSQERKEWENGAFTEGLLQALSGSADDNGDGVINIGELHHKARSIVVRITEGEQTPTQTGSTLNHGVTNIAKVKKSN